jgi:hypothetical protein
MKIPRRDPEIVQAIADKLYGGDTEKVPTTTLRSPIAFLGVAIFSRYNQADEFELMVNMVRVLGTPLRRRTGAIHYYSKCGSLAVVLKSWNEDMARVIGEMLDGKLRQHRGAITDSADRMSNSAPAGKIELPRRTIRPPSRAILLRISATLNSGSYGSIP